MTKFVEKAKLAWNDPVWSKVISAGIIFILGWACTLIWSILKNVHTQIIEETHSSNLYKLITTDVTLPLWELALLIIILGSGILLIIPKAGKPLWNLISKISSKIQSKIKGSALNERPKAREHSTSFFSSRIAKAFPGVRSITWFDNPKEINRRLKILLSQPLEFSDGPREAEVDPIWWFRGNSAMQINKFKRIGCRKSLLDIDELRIKRIAVFHSSGRYYSDFVYVEVSPDKPTGLYKYDKDIIKYFKESHGYFSEEYAIFKYFRLLRKKIRIEEHDDGATKIFGRIWNTFGSEPRLRYLTDYNFIIAAKGSPYNSQEFCRCSIDYFNGILQGTKKPDDFFDYLDSLPKQRY